MNCPECGAECRPGERHCPECGLPLMRRSAPPDDRSEFAPPREDSTLSVASLVLGVFSLPLSCACGFFAFPMGIVAIVLGFVGMNKGGKGMAIAGIVCGALSIVSWILLMIFGMGMAVMEQQNAPG